MSDHDVNVYGLNVAAHIQLDFSEVEGESIRLVWTALALPCTQATPTQSQNTTFYNKQQQQIWIMFLYRTLAFFFQFCIGELKCLPELSASLLIKGRCSSFFFFFTFFVLAALEVSVLTIQTILRSVE